MLYVNILGGQKWRPTCTGSEVCTYVNVDVSFFFFLIKYEPSYFCSFQAL